MYKPFNSKNSIVNYALEAMAADAAAAEANAEGADGNIKPVDTTGGTAPESTEQVQATDIEDVDAVAALQERVAVLEDENGVMETDLIEASGDQVQDDLDDAIGAAVALESLGQLAMATYINGTASLQSNAGIAIGLEHICSSLGLTSIVAAVEEDGVDSQGNAAKNLGERALSASKEVVKQVLAFLKKIKDWFVGFINTQVNGVQRLVQVLQSLQKDMNQLNHTAVIEDAQFIQAIGFQSEDPYREFQKYVEFSNDAMEYFGSGSLFSNISQLLRRDAADKTEQIFNKVTGDIGRLFHAKVISGAGVGMSSGPVILGGSSFVVAHNGGEGGTYTLKASIVPSDRKVTINKVKVMTPNQAESLLNDMAQWSKLNSKIAATMAKVDSIVNMNDVDTATAENVRSFMSVVSQVSSVLVPSILSTNVSTLRKFTAYIRKALEVSRAASAAA